MTVCSLWIALTRRGCGSTKTTSSGSGEENQPAGSLLSGPRPATRLMLSALQARREVSRRGRMLAEAAWRASDRGAMSGGRTNGVGYEATQWRRRVDVVRRNARDPHAHAQ